MKSIALDELTVSRGVDFTLGPLSLTFEAATRTALVGPSGAGKTTLLRCIAGLMKPTSGRLRFGDQVVSGDGISLPPERRRIGYVFQSGALWPHLTAVQHLRFCSPGLTAERARELLAQVGLGDLTARRPAQLSGGEAQRLGLARALVGEPEILLLDEPLRSVDPHLRDELGNLVQRIADDRGLTLIAVTHDRAEALALGQRVVILRNGAVIEEGDATDLVQRPATAFGAAFLGAAACWPTAAGADGRLRTPFGDIPVPAGARSPLALVVLPGDAEIPNGGARSPGRADEHSRDGVLLAIEPTAFGAVARVELDGQLVRVAMRGEARVGDVVQLRLTSPPRLLPIDLPAHGGTP